jgi:hypothetical protein
MKYNSSKEKRRMEKRSKGVDEENMRETKQDGKKEREDGEREKKDTYKEKRRKSFVSNVKNYFRCFSEFYFSGYTLKYCEL